MKNNRFYLIHEKHFTRSLEILDLWEDDPMVSDIAKAMKGLLKAIMKAGKIVEIPEEE